MDNGLKEKLGQWAEKYETADFLQGDPSWFMHQMQGTDDKEVMAFVAACLSYGQRKAFMPKIRQIMDASGRQPYSWLLSGAYRQWLPDDDRCFYRLYTCHAMIVFFDALSSLLHSYGSIKVLVSNGIRQAEQQKASALQALELITGFFSGKGVHGIVPKDTTSSCKRLCMFLRWMVRDASPVDLGLWSDLIDKRSLIIPLDTHVLAEATALGLISSRSASMHTALRLSARLLELFPEDPLRADFALFGYGVNK